MMVLSRMENSTFDGEFYVMATSVSVPVCSCGTWIYTLNEDTSINSFKLSGCPE